MKVTMSFGVRRRPFRIANQAMTETLTKVNAISAPKLMNAAMSFSVKAAASRLMRPTRTMLNVGVRVFGSMWPKRRRGRTLLRPITRSMRDTEACEASPEASVAQKPAAVSAA